MLENLVGGGFRGKLFAVNPKHASVRGIACVPSVADLPETPDLAVIATPAATVAGLIDACGAKGIRAAVVIRRAPSRPAVAARELDWSRRRGTTAWAARPTAGLMRPRWA